MKARSTAGVWLLLYSSTVALNPGAARSHVSQAVSVYFDVTADQISTENFISYE